MKTIAVDIDDTLANFAQAFAELSNELWGMNLTADDYCENWASIWQVDSVERKRRGDIVEQSGIQAILAHDQDAARVLAELKRDYRLIVISSRPKHLQQVSIEWVNRYYPDIFDDIQFADMWNDRTRLHLAHVETKATICNQLQVDYLIDDQAKHCVAVADTGIKAILFGDYTWNRGINLPDGVVRAHTWDDVHQYFAKIGSRA